MKLVFFVFILLSLRCAADDSSNLTMTLDDDHRIYVDNETDDTVSMDATEDVSEGSKVNNKWETGTGKILH